MTCQLLNHASVGYEPSRNLPALIGWEELTGGLCQHYWSVFEKEFGLNYAEIQKFTKDMVEKHFKMKAIISKF